MWRYLKAAFFVRPNVPGLGNVPINVLGLVCCGVLGVAFPPIWFAGLGVEVSFLALLATNRRFQKVVDSRAMLGEHLEAEAKRRSLIAQLEGPARAQLAELQRRCFRAEEIARKQGIEDFVIDANRDALLKLCWLYLRLLVARQFIMSQESQTTAFNLREQLHGLQRELKSEKLAPSLRESKAETMRLVQERLNVLERRENVQREIDSDLTRIEAQVDLALDNASVSAQPHAVSSNITLTSRLLDPVLFGNSSQTVADLDLEYNPPDASQSAAKESA